MKREHKKLYVISICVVLVLAIIIAYEPVRLNGFVTYDDNAYVTENTNVYNGITYKSVIWAFTKIYKINWHPLTWLSHMLDCEIYGLEPLGHHITNLLIHIANSLLLFLLLRRMTGAVWKSAFVAAVFALHPIHVESVAWVAERKDVLSGLFWMLTIIAYQRYTERPNAIRYGLVVMAFAMGLMSKPMMVTLPFVLLLLDYWPLGRFQLSQPESNCQSVPTWHLIKEKIPLFILSAISSTVTFVGQSGTMASWENMPLQLRIINSLGSYTNYIVKMLYPKGLAVLYPIPEKAQTGAAVLTVLLVAVLVILWVRRRSRRWLLVGLLWYMGTLIPVVGLVQVGRQLIADRYTYLPSIGVLIIAAWGAEEILSKRRHPKMIAACGSATALVAMVFMTRIQVGYWRNSSTLFSRAIAVTENNYFMHTVYGQQLCIQGRYDEGAWHLKEAIRIKPDCLPPRVSLYRVPLAQGKVDESIACLTKALQERDDWPDIHMMYRTLGLSYEQKGDFAQAEINYKKALKARADYENALNSLREVLLKQGKIEEAVAYFSELLHQNENSVAVHSCLATVLGIQGKYDKAIKHFGKALELNPGYPDAHHGMGTALLAAGRTSEAIAHLKAALRTNTNIEDVYAKLGNAYDQLGKYDLAIQSWSKVVELDPNNIGAANNAAWLLATIGDVSIQDADKAIELAERVNELTGYKNPGSLDTLAAAYAASGRFDDAVKTAEKAINLAETQNQKELAQRIQKRLELYKVKEPYHKR